MAASLEDWMSVIRSCLITSKDPMTLFELNRDTRSLEGKDIPFQEFNYKSLVAMLRATPGVIVNEKAGNIYVHAVPSKETAHIMKMVQLQKKKKKKRKNNRNYKSNYNEIVKRINNQSNGNERMDEQRHSAYSNSSQRNFKSMNGNKKTNQPSHSEKIYCNGLQRNFNPIREQTSKQSINFDRGPSLPSPPQLQPVFLPPYGPPRQIQIPVQQTIQRNYVSSPTVFQRLFPPLPKKPLHYEPVNEYHHWYYNGPSKNYNCDQRYDEYVDGYQSCYDNHNEFIMRYKFHPTYAYERYEPYLHHRRYGPSAHVPRRTGRNERSSSRHLNNYYNRYDFRS